MIGRIDSKETESTQQERVESTSNKLIITIIMKNYMKI